MNILVSACLLGEPCRYDGAAKPNESVRALSAVHHLVPVCPELLGGLPVPRAPCEIVCGKVIDCNGADKTAAYQRGAEKTLCIARKNACIVAILKEKSPSCGCGTIHNGKFDGGLVRGNGITAQRLLDQHIAVYGESAAETLFAKI